MRNPLRLAKRLSADQRGATVVEYGLIISLIVLAIFGALQSVGQNTGAMWNFVSIKVVSAH